MGFHNRFKLLLDNTNTSQKELSKIIGISSQAVSKWYTGRAEPDSNTLKLIANHFNISIDFLLENEHNNQNNKEETKFHELEIIQSKLQKEGYLKPNETLTEQELKNIIEFITINKKYLRNIK